MLLPLASGNFSPSLEASHPYQLLFFTEVHPLPGKNMILTF